MTEKTAKKERYTYINFANECIALAQELTALKFEGMSVRDLENFNAKARDLLAIEQRRKERALTAEKKEKVSKTNPEVEAKRQAIITILSDTPMTAADINLALGMNYTPMYIGSLLARNPEIEKVEVIKEIKEFTKNGSEIVRPKPMVAYKLKD